jgi:RNA polymerase sigma factor (sigma-70 family)
MFHSGPSNGSGRSVPIVSDSDEQLVAAWRQSGDRGPLETLATRHLATVHRMVHSMTLNEVLADDLVQEVFLRAFRSLSAFQGRAQFTTWLYRITMNVVHDTLARGRRSPIDGRRELPLDTASRADLPEARVEQAELDEAVTRAIAMLPPKLRAAAVLVMIEELDPAEAARIEGCSRATIYWRLHEARKRLASSLREHAQP